MANTYGSGAIGGVVVFETKDADDFLREGETWAGSATGRYDTNGEGWTTSGTGAYRFSDSFDVLGNIVWRDFDDYTDGNGDEVAGSSFDVLSGLLKSSIRPTDNSELKLGWIGAQRQLDRGRQYVRAGNQAEHLHGPLQRQGRRRELARPPRQRLRSTRPISTRPI